MVWDVIAVGDNCIDRLTGAVQVDLVGGNAANVAVQVARRGLQAAYVGAVGPKGESDGDRVVATLASNGIDLTYLDRRDRQTSVTILHVGPDGDRRILHEDFGACLGWSPNPAARAALTTARHVHIGWLDDGGDLRRTLSAQGLSVSQDVSVNAEPINLGVDGLTVAFASLPAEKAGQAEERAAELLARGARGAVVTLGSAGSLAMIDGQVHRAGTPQIDPVDTTGAGDSYIAGFLAARLSGASVSDAMAAGHALAVACCFHAGGFPQ